MGSLCMLGRSFFHKIASLFGKFLGLDEWTRFTKRLEYGRILLATPSNAPIDKAIQVRIDGVDFVVTIVKEREVYRHQNKKRSCSPSTSDSSPSESCGSWFNRALDGSDSVWIPKDDDDDMAGGSDEVSGDPVRLGLIHEKSNISPTIQN
ncbi:hypothetical protein Lalb_Chr17g0337731 [Lupinus albus]|uniref:Uncharacterized protein n=1 Tax=Lupinus albus TaxID=3870 RepID=A0A6A4P6K8_LUPAL|nr:hypothetical protein Lalb_Chr17g0337731 [Lupinus albus]